MARGVVGLGLGVGLGEGEVRETNASRWSSLWRWADRTFERKPIVAHDRLKAARRARDDDDLALADVLHLVLEILQCIRLPPFVELATLRLHLATSLTALAFSLFSQIDIVPTVKTVL